MNQLKASIIVAMYNGEATVEKTLNSILAQAYENYEIIIVDDGSTDSSKHVVEKYLDSPKVRYVFKENGGVAAARNVGIEYAEGDIVGFCDQDDLWKPNKLEKQMEAFEQHPDVGVVYSWIEVDRNGDFSISKPRFEGECFKALLMQNFISCCTGMARRNLLLEIGGFDESRELHGVDDRHVWLRLARITRFGVVSEPLATYVIHGANYSLNEAKMLTADLICISKISSISGLTEQERAWCKEAKYRVYRHYASNFFYINELKECSSCYSNAWMLKRYRIDLLITSLILKVTPRSLLVSIKKMRKRIKGEVA
ncbi:hypothetical protein C7Y69_02295 [Alteromonas sp. KS69]|uniref:glycosyltransferase family 2 protein n=1 Tax=Alteromonas sp. KS69 TaxID=2109917 RepID=UPI000F87BEFB|nr:glycosyltransferase family A protein [Alteromonas sp. KS69]RUP83382.1 hypothetical protein C7Y69_02295 [Alteromonas sp. KS69]